MRKALRLACASPIPHSRPWRRASSTGTYSTRLAMFFSPLLDPDAREFRDLRVLSELVAYEGAELTGGAGPGLDAELRKTLPDLGRADRLHDDAIQPRDDVFRNGG